MCLPVCTRRNERIKQREEMRKEKEEKNCQEINKGIYF